MLTEGNRSRRLTIALTSVFVIFVVFTFRLVDIQIIRARKLESESTNSLSVTHLLHGDRGAITTSDGTVLAAAVLRYDVTAAPINASTFTRALPHGKHSTVTVATAMQELAGATGANPLTMSHALLARPKANFAYLVKSINLAQYQAVVALHIPYVYLERHMARSYPDGAVAGNLPAAMGRSPTKPEPTESSFPEL
jgi:cell division protein FtsI (penicillin-binding protein 3)